MTRVLILTSASGAGHDRVAQVLGHCLLDSGRERVKVVIADPFQGTALPSRILRLYGPAIVSASWLWGLVYHLSDNRRWTLSLASPLERAMARTLEREKPDVVISVHPLCHGAALRVLRRMGRKVPVAVMITDLRDVHVAWQDPGVSVFLAPTPDVVEQLISYGLPSEKVHCMGVPVHSEFRDGNGASTNPREELGLDPDRPAVLVTGGGEGAGPIERAASTVIATLPESQVIVACGRNDALRRRLDSLGFPARVLGFVENMPQWTRSCDVVVGKAGALTVAEATAARRPLIIIDALPGQERGNLKYVLESGIGVHAPPERRLARALRDLAAQQFRPIRWLENMARVDRPDASERIVSLILERVLADD